jgi:O-antigen/teichoic acid export membrane protein
MSNTLSDLKRMASTSGLYAVGSLLNRGLAFLLLPIYTRYLPQEEYGALDLFNAFSGVLFAILLLGLPSALTKVFHRDCETEEERSTTLATALMLDLPVLFLGGGLLFFFAEPVGRWIIGKEGMGPLVQLVAATAVSASLIAIVLSSFRSRERAMAFVALNLLQFVPSMVFNIVLVVHLGLGVMGVLWGNLLASLIALPVGLWMASRRESLRFDRRLVRPLLHFGVLLIPVTLASWVIDLSDRYVLRIFRDLEQIAIYGVGYKIGSILMVAVVWPFQLAWPAVSFSISRRQGHEKTYARVTVYFAALLTLCFLGLSLLSRSGLPLLAGESYREAAGIVPWVALAYVFHGLHFCLAPGIHVSGHTRYVTMFSGVAALLNLGLNFLIVPRFGVVGAAWTTTFTFFFMAAAPWVFSQRLHPVPHDLGQLGRSPWLALESMRWLWGLNRKDFGWAWAGI